MSLQERRKISQSFRKIPLKESYRDHCLLPKHGTQKRGEKRSAQLEIDEPSTQERSSRRLIGARLLKYLLGFDRSQLREESAQSQYYPPTSLRRGIMRRNSRRVEGGGKEASRDAERTRRPTILSSRGIY